MVDPFKDWPEPLFTANAMILTGFIVGLLMREEDRFYTPTNIGSPIVVEAETGNRFRISVEQIGGTE